MRNVLYAIELLLVLAVAVGVGAFLNKNGVIHH